MATSSARSDWAWSSPHRDEDVAEGRAFPSPVVDDVERFEADVEPSEIDVELPGWAPEGYVYVWPDDPATSVVTTILKLAGAFVGAAATAVLGIALAAKLLLMGFEALFPKAF